MIARKHVEKEFSMRVLVGTPLAGRRQATSVARLWVREGLPARSVHSAYEALDPMYSSRFSPGVKAVEGHLRCRKLPGSRFHQ
jgi:hypothetical protein